MRRIPLMRRGANVLMCVYAVHGLCIQRSVSLEINQLFFVGRSVELLSSVCARHSTRYQCCFLSSLFTVFFRRYDLFIQCNCIHSVMCECENFHGKSWKLKCEKKLENSDFGGFQSYVVDFEGQWIFYSTSFLPLHLILKHFM